MSRSRAWLTRWHQSGDTGVSSKAIARALAGEHLDAFPRPPQDPADVGRCVRLLDLAAENGEDWRARLDEVGARVPAWRPLLPHWELIEASYLEQLAHETAHPRKRGQSGRPSHCYYLLRVLQGDRDPYAGQDVPWARLSEAEIAQAREETP